MAVSLIALAVLLVVAVADIPVHCRHDEIVGDWIFHIGDDSAAGCDEPAHDADSCCVIV